MSVTDIPYKTVVYGIKILLVQKLCSILSLIPSLLHSLKNSPKINAKSEPNFAIDI